VESNTEAIRRKMKERAWMLLGAILMISPSPHGFLEI
jgi:hypothetical protein